MTDKLNLSLQQFAEETPEPELNTDEKSEQTEQEKTFTQQDVNNIVARETKSTVERLLKEAGISDGSDYKRSLTEFKKWQDSQKSELELATEKITQAEAKATEAEKQMQEMRNQVEALSKGIPQNRIAQYIKLAEVYKDDDTEFTDALDKALQEFPLMNNAQKQTGGNPVPFMQPQDNKKKYGDMTIL